MRFNSILFVLIFFISKGFSQELALARFDDKYGYLNKSGEWQISPQFESAKDFVEDLAEAMGANEKWGFINRNGEWQIQPKFVRVKEFNSGIALAYDGDRWFYINRKGEEVLKNVKTVKYYDFSEGFAIVRSEDGKVGFIDTLGNYIVEPKFEKVHDFVNGYARVSPDGKWGIIDVKGKYFVEPNYRRVGNVYLGNVVVENENEEVGLIIEGKFKVVEGARKIWDFSYNGEFTYAKKDDFVGFINNKGEWVVEPQFDKARAFLNGLAPVMLKNKWGYINTSGELVIDYKFKDADVFSKDGLAPVKLKKRWGFIDKTGKLVIQDEYDIHSRMGGFGIGGRRAMRNFGLELPNFGFIDGLARVKKDKEWGFIDANGEVLNNTWYQNLELFQ
ncbi:WG repeat-containing protein [Mangrovimonas sp. YM274]|uniref:WG repeat-containing protein n=1 Tax=Mangrovimonas sp. YM274 TaxID=3070660 RepID=UPI0027DC976C|nr:WG repeat-containing protein [Mangrovimonas sp. YM274]WMI69459.1 WG repeat-containing protein [Mangrovimonas sp. YM274]